jgi:uncharacterized protein (TIGR02594 family)
MSEPGWLQFARTHIGQKEIPGRGSNPWIRDLWFRFKGEWLWTGDDSAVPWCGAFITACFSPFGIAPPQHWYRAKGWLDWGIPLDVPTVGAVVVFERKGGGHVGLVVGEDQNQSLMTLGGNQLDSVSIAPFDRARVLGYRWPAGTVVRIGPLPLIESGARVSTNEA